VADDGLTPRWTAVEFAQSASDVAVDGMAAHEWQRNEIASMLRQAAESERTLVTIRELCASCDESDDYSAVRFCELRALLPPAGTR
jgi:hypothetical protein